ncbi:MAG: 8-amino-7-oxononanoate synthase [Proteobacteria bacterium]|nr:8-amino-7-oxononanoate synthase [Pseudomonadota bacterium]
MPRTFFPYSRFTALLRQKHLLRHLPANRSFLYDFSNNDYLGLSQNPLVIQAAIKAADQDGVGAKASRLIASQKALKALECTIAKSKKTSSALIFSTGFQANLSVISAILDRKVLGTVPLVFADRLNHASMHAACQLAQVKQQRYRHCDYDHLEALLKASNSTQPKFILTESVFGMDGDVACLETLVKLAKDNSALLYVDDAHATGLFGANGYGLTEDFAKEIDITMGTFSKALGSSGAYITCHKTLRRYLINRCQGFIFSTAPSPMQVAAMQAAWDLVPCMQPKAKILLQTAQHLKEALQAMGFETGNTKTHIIPIILSDPKRTLVAQQFLASKGICVSAIRPPSVPPLQSRLRIALNCNHTSEAINALINGLRDLKISAFFDRK